MGTGNTGVVGRATVLAGVFLLVGVGTAMTVAVALVSLSGVGEETVHIVVVATFLLGPSLAGAVSVATARDAASSSAAAVAGGVGALVGFYAFAAVALGTAIVVADAAGVAPGVTVDSLLVPVLVVGLPTGAVGATGGYLGGRVGRRSRDREPAVASSRSNTDARDRTAGRPGAVSAADPDGAVGDGGDTDRSSTTTSDETTGDEGDTGRSDAADSNRTGDVSDLFDDADGAVDASK